MEIRVYNAELYRVGQVENQTSLIWTRKFFEAGNFEIHAPITPKNLELFQTGNIVSIKGAKEAGVIEDKEADDADGGPVDRRNALGTDGRTHQASDKRMGRG